MTLTSMLVPRRPCAVGEIRNERAADAAQLVGLRAGGDTYACPGVSTADFDAAIAFVRGDDA